MKFCRPTGVRIFFKFLLLFAIAMDLVACGGGLNDPSATAVPDSAPVARPQAASLIANATASIVGLTSGGLVLDIINANCSCGPYFQSVPANTTSIILGSRQFSYHVSVSVQPAGLVCSAATNFINGKVNASVPIVVTCTLPPRNSWTWVSGSNLVNGAGSYGTQGAPAAGNSPGARTDSSTWSDGTGNLWLFGGDGNDGSGHNGYLNDLWKFDPRARQWAWMSGTGSLASGPAYGNYGTQGVDASTNVPGGRRFSMSAADRSGNLWLFGGYGASSTTNGVGLNDLWKYSTTTGHWTWVSGSSTGSTGPSVYGTPGTPYGGPSGRTESGAWIDVNGNFWLFGGNGFDAGGTGGMLNDMWMFNPTIGMWTWVGGSNMVNGSASYGSQGVPSPSNTPGARYGAAAWSDAQGNFWLFGGFGIDATGLQGVKDDLWKFDPTAHTWTWMSGSSGVRRSGNWGAKGVPASTNSPGGRTYPRGWTDTAGNVWIFGGQGPSGSNTVFNDLWEYSSTKGWIWISGSSQADIGGIYGSQGTASTANAPGARYGGTSWVDAAGDFWIFGGFGFDAEGTNGQLNDLWEYLP